jgi:hypothetical protein
VINSIYAVIHSAGEDANLELCLDAGALASYSGSGTSWNDLTANARHFTTSSLSFNGVAGNLSSSEYFSTAGAGTAALTGAQPAVFDAMHKDSAAFTVMWAGYIGANAASGQTLWGDCSGTPGGTGVQSWNNSGPTTAQLIVLNAGSYVSPTSGYAPGAADSTGTWMIRAWSVAEATPAIISWKNGAQDGSTSSTAYVSPASGAASNKLQLFGNGAGGSLMTSGTRLGFFAMWSRALSVASLNSIYNLATYGPKARYGL